MIPLEDVEATEEDDGTDDYLTRCMNMEIYYVPFQGVSIEERIRIIQYAEEDYLKYHNLRFMDRYQNFERALGIVPSPLNFMIYDNAELLEAHHDMLIFTHIPYQQYYLDRMLDVICKPPYFREIP